MKVFISADIEGTAVTATREGCRPGEFEYERSRKEMTAEVVAAAEGARAAGARAGGGEGRPRAGAQYSAGGIAGVCPAHPKLERLTGDDGGRTGQQLRCRLFRGLSQCGGGGRQRPEPHHQRRRGSSHHRQRQPASEFLIYSWMAAWYGVPSVLLTGDKTLCEVGAELHPSLVTVPVKDDVGGRSRASAQFWPTDGSGRGQSGQ